MSRSLIFVSMVYADVSEGLYGMVVAMMMLSKTNGVSC